jgi:hypothetical protein
VVDHVGAPASAVRRYLKMKWLPIQEIFDGNFKNESSFKVILGEYPAR